MSCTHENTCIEICIDFVTHRVFEQEVCMDCLKGVGEVVTGECKEDIQKSMETLRKYRKKVRESA